MTCNHSSTTITITRAEEPDWDLIGGGINDYNTRQAGPENSHMICYLLQDAEGTKAGGIIAIVHWGWLYINLLWIQDEFRGQGYGAQLMEMAEVEGIQYGAQYAYLDTFTFQAPGFYEKLGYTIVGELPDFPEGHTRFYMKKEL